MIWFKYQNFSYQESQRITTKMPCSHMKKFRFPTVRKNIFFKSSTSLCFRTAIFIFSHKFWKSTLFQKNSKTFPRKKLFIQVLQFQMQSRATSVPAPKIFPKKSSFYTFLENTRIWFAFPLFLWWKFYQFFILKTTFFHIYQGKFICVRWQRNVPNFLPS